MATTSSAASDHDLVYPAHFGDRVGWKSSTIPSPIAPLEFDLRARAFVCGFRRALRELFGTQIEVGVRRLGGYLFTLVDVDGDAAMSASYGLSRPDFRHRWLTQVRPRVTRLIAQLRHASRQWPADDGDLLRTIGAWLEEVTFLHHTLLLPARATLAEFAGFVVAEGLLDDESHALMLLAGHRNATNVAAHRLWGLRLGSTNPTSARWSPAALDEVAQEGEGYGLLDPGWIEDGTVAHAIVGAYASAEPSSAPARRLRQAADIGRSCRARVESALRDRPTIAEQFAALAHSARSAIGVTEDHAPLMHARVSYELRRCVLAVGRRLVDAGQLQEPTDILFLHVDEVASTAADVADLAGRRRCEFDRILRPPDLAPAPTSALAAEQPDASSLGRYVRQVFGTPAGAKRDRHAIAGDAASPGRATGPVRKLRRHVDLGSVCPDEILVVPNNSSIWSFGLSVAAAVLAPGGSRFGHLASLARDYARPAVVGLDPSGLHRLADGDVVEVDGTAGTVRQPRDPGREP